MDNYPGILFDVPYGSVLVICLGIPRKSHYCLIEAIKGFYVDEGLLSNQYIEALLLGKALRENAGYHGDFDAASAQEMITAANDFELQAKTILKRH